MVARRAAVVLLCLWAGGAPIFAHPHPGDVVTDTFRGRVTEVSLERRTIAIDALDRKTKKIRNYFFFLDPKVKVTRAKKKIPFGELAPGEAVICVAEIELNERGEATRYIAFDIRIDTQARPAVY
jgi:hypothetical protein